MANFAKPLAEIGELALSTRAVEEGLASIGQKLAADGILANLAERMGAKIPEATTTAHSMIAASGEARVADLFVRRSDILLPSVDSLSAPGHATLDLPFIKHSDIVLPGVKEDAAAIQAADRWRLPPDVVDPRGPDPHGPNPHDEVHDPFLPANNPGGYFDLDDPRPFRRPEQPDNGRFPHESPLPSGRNWRGGPGDVMDRWKRGRTSGSIWKK